MVICLAEVIPCDVYTQHYEIPREINVFFPVYLMAELT